VAQASSQWRQFVRLWHSSSVNRESLLQTLERFRGIGGWLTSLTLGVALLLWNWQLVVATGLGLLAMVLIYWAQQSRWQLALLTWQRLWSRSNRQLTLAVTGGGIATFSTYMATTVWLRSDDPWLATGTIFQGLGTLAVLLLLLWQALRPRTTRQSDYEQMLSSLVEPDPLKRLIAVRQVTHWASSNALEFTTPWAGRSPHRDTTRSHLADCFRLMLSQETEPTIQTALLEGLQALSTEVSLGQAEPPFSMPIQPAVTKLGHQAHLH
jgi:hypothetical protein